MGQLILINGKSHSDLLVRDAQPVSIIRKKNQEERILWSGMIKLKDKTYALWHHCFERQVDADQFGRCLPGIKPAKLDGLKSMKFQSNYDFNSAYAVL